MQGRIRVGLVAAYGFYLLCVGYLVFAPQPTTPGGAVDRLTRWIRWGLGFPEITANHVEFALNVVMFVPLTLLGAFVFPRLGAARWMLIALAATVGIETVQFLALPDRSGGVRDVVSNSLGAALGLVLAAAVRHDLRSARRRTAVLTGTARSALLGVLAGAALIVAVLLLGPSRSLTDGLVVDGADLLHALGAPDRLARPIVWELVANVLVTVPLGVLGALLLPRSPVAVWLAVGLVAAAAVELVQAWFLPARDSSLSDVVANTLGLGLGALLGHVGTDLTVRFRNLR